ncbi:MAG: efflux RND transporter periplasmic adaptor subunit, partial [Acidobacteriota bacterium]
MGLRRMVWILVVVVVAAAASLIYLRRPQVAQAGPDTAPEMAGMSGVSPPAPLSPTGPAAAPRGDVSIDPRRQQLTGVRTTTVKETSDAPTIRAVGAVRYDEHRLADINLKVEGFIRELYVDTTGQVVSLGAPLFSLYSPDVLNTANEYVLALKTRDQVQQSEVADARERADQLVAASRQRLALWDVSPDQIRALEQSRIPTADVTFHSPARGVVVEKSAVKGMHVMPGQTLYRIADLSVVWVEADVYERDVPAVRVGARAAVSIDAYPGERFDGRVLFIYPYVDEKTRTNKVRFEFPNRGGRLKPGMYANVELTGRARRGLVVPSNALLDSGTEQIVFVSTGDGHFEPRRVKAGARVGEDVQILEGLKAGEDIVTAAAFFLDSESQLRAAVQGFEAPQTNPQTTGSSPVLDIAFRVQPDPPKVGENTFDVIVKDDKGQPVADAEVTVQLFMAAMPSMNMPASRNEVR